MKRKLCKQILLASVVIFMSLLLIGCGDDGGDDDPYLTQIVVTPGTVSDPIPIGVTQQFTATGTYSDESQQDISTSVTWSSSHLLPYLSMAMGWQPERLWVPRKSRHQVRG